MCSALQGFGPSGNRSIWSVCGESGVHSLEASSVLTSPSLCHSGIEATTLVQAELGLQHSTRTASAE